MGDGILLLGSMLDACNERAQVGTPVRGPTVGEIISGMAGPSSGVKTENPNPRKRGHERISIQGLGLPHPLSVRLTNRLRTKSEDSGAELLQTELLKTLDQHARSWNQGKLRKGDRARVTTTEGEQDKENNILFNNGSEWDPDAVVLLAFAGIGRKDAHHSRETASSLSAMMLTSMAWQTRQSSAITILLKSFEVTPPAWLWLQLQGDCTPIVLEFGKMLQALAAPTARYFELRKEEGGEERWRKMSYAEYIASNGVLPRSGCVECLGARGELMWAERISSPENTTSSPLEAMMCGKGAMRIRKEKLLSRMLMLERNNASVMYRAFQTFEPSLKFETLIRLLLCIRWLCVGVKTDDAKVCGRMKVGMRERLHDLRGKLAMEQPLVRLGRLLFLGTLCVVHIFVGALDKAASTGAMAATMYSTSFVTGHHAFYRTMSGRLGEFVDKVLVMGRRPEQKVVDHSRRVMRATVARRLHTRGRGGGTGTGEAKSEEELLQLCDDFVDFFPGPYQRRGVLIHGCKGRSCVCKGFRVTAVRIGTDLCSRMWLRDTPAHSSVSKWWTQEQNMTYQESGDLIHGFLPAYMMFCFGEVQEWAPLADGAIEDPISSWRRYSSKNVVKCRESLNSEDHQVDLLVCLLTSDPVDTADNLIQHMDAKAGGILFEMIRPGGIFARLQDALGALVFEPFDLDQVLASIDVESPAGRMLMLKKMALDHFEERTEMLEKFTDRVASAAECVSAIIWHKAELPHQNPPLSLGRTQSPFETSEERDAQCHLHYHRPKCCNDRDFTAELLADMKGPEEFKTPEVSSLILGHNDIYDASDMPMENFLSQARESVAYSKRRPSIERMYAASHLSSVMKEWLDTGHTDMRRPQAQVDAASIITLKKEMVAKRGVRRKKTNGFLVFMREQYPEWARSREFTGERKDVVTFRTHEGAVRWNKLTLLQQDRYGSAARAENNSRRRFCEPGIGGARTEMPFGIASDPGQWFPVNGSDLKAKAGEAQVNGCCWLPGPRAMKRRKAQLLPPAVIGFRNNATKLRWREKTNVYVQDRADIPANKDFVVPRACWQAHPGVCRTKDSWCYAEILKSAAAFMKLLEKSSRGSFYLLTGHGEMESEPEMKTFLSFAPIEQIVKVVYVSANPKFALLQPWKLKSLTDEVATLTAQPRATVARGPSPTWGVRPQLDSMLQDEAMRRLFYSPLATLFPNGKPASISAELLSPERVVGCTGVKSLRMSERQEPLQIWCSKKVAPKKTSKTVLPGVKAGVDVYAKVLAMMCPPEDDPARSKAPGGKPKQPRAGKISYARPTCDGKGAGPAPSGGLADLVTCGTGLALGDPQLEEFVNGDVEEGSENGGESEDSNVDGYLSEEDRRVLDMEPEDWEPTPVRESKKGKEKEATRKRPTQAESKQAKKAEADRRKSEEVAKRKREEEERRAKEEERKAKEEEEKAKQREELQDAKWRFAVQQSMQEVTNPAGVGTQRMNDLVASVLKDRSQRISQASGSTDANWSLARNSSEATCVGCGALIRRHGPRLVYRPDAYFQGGVFTAGQLKRYHHMKATCILKGACPILADGGPLSVDMAPVPARMRPGPKEAGTHDEASLVAAARSVFAEARGAGRSAGAPT